MSIRTEILFLESVLEQTSSLEEALLIEQDLPTYVGRLCEGLELSGYEFRSTFTVDQLIEALEWVLLTDKRLSPAMEGFFGKAVGALKTAVTKGVASVKDAHHGFWYDYHSNRASKAHDTATRGKFSRKANEKYIKHYKKAAHHQLYADPKNYRADTIRQVGDASPIHGSRDAARKNLFTGRQASRNLLSKKKVRPVAPKPKHSPTMDMPTNPGRPRNVGAK